MTSQARSGGFARVPVKEESDLEALTGTQPSSGPASILKEFLQGSSGRRWDLQAWREWFRDLSTAAKAAVIFVPLLAIFIVWRTVGRSGVGYSYERCHQMVVEVPKVSDLTLDEKIGQMTQIDARHLGDGRPVTDFFLGSVLSGGGGHSEFGNTARDWANMVDGMQAKALKTRLRIPMLYGVDAVHGHNNVYGTTIFPHNIGLGATRNPSLVQKIARATALEVLATGIRWDFAPALIMCRDPRWGRCYESFSEDPEVVRRMVTAITGYQGAGPDDAASLGISGTTIVAACAKHFLGDGGTTGGKDQGDTNVTEQVLKDLFLPPYEDAVKLGVETVMISYSSWRGQKMHGNKRLITDVLKGELGFKGVVVSDWAAIDQLPGTSYNAQVRDSINAGLDMIMVPFEPRMFTEALKQEVEAGRVALARVDDAVARILDLKERLGLFQQPCADRSFMQYVGAQPHRDLARQAVRESLVLLKNSARGGGPLFPLPASDARYLVTGSHAANLGYQCGGWTITWQGLSGQSTIGTTFLAAMRAAAEKSSIEVVYAEKPTGEEEADYAIVVVGEPPYAEMKGDRLAPAAPQLPPAAVQLATSTCARLRCVVVLMSGRPLLLPAELLNSADAIVAAWLPGSEGGGGVADVLLGETHDFGGRLPHTWVRSASQLPMPSGSDPYDPLFAFGFGLNKAGVAL